MTKRSKILLTMIAMSLPTSMAHSQTATLRNQLQSVIRHQNDNLARKDATGYLTTVADDFKGTDVHGKTYDKTGYRQSVIQLLSLVQSIRRDATVERVTPAPGGVTVWSSDRTSLKFVTAATHTKHTLIFDSTWRSLWTKTPQGWRKRRETQLSETITSDGKSRVVKPSPAKPK